MLKTYITLVSHAYSQINIYIYIYVIITCIYEDKEFLNASLVDLDTNFKITILKEDTPSTVAPFVHSNIRICINIRILAHACEYQCISLSLVLLVTLGFVYIDIIPNSLYFFFTVHRFRKRGINFRIL